MLQGPEYQFVFYPAFLTFWFPCPQRLL